ncbi:MAG: hypothetical protein Q4Q53_04075 [Methanocorpusculum sp.]|nr:hypothetical protein [Methanocorpusculum sp.]
MSDVFSWTPAELEKIYIVSRLVHRGEIEAEPAAQKLAGILGNPAHNNIMYFSMYQNMMKGMIFRQSGGDDMIIYFLKRIADEKGPESLSTALKSVYGYSGFKESVGCFMDDLNKACAELEIQYGLKK